MNMLLQGNVFSIEAQRQSVEANFCRVDFDDSRMPFVVIPSLEASCQSRKNPLEGVPRPKPREPPSDGQLSYVPQRHTKRLSVDHPTWALCQRAFHVELKVYVTYLIFFVYIDYAVSAVPEDELASTVPEDESALAISEDAPEQTASGGLRMVETSKNYPKALKDHCKDQYLLSNPRHLCKIPHGQWSEENTGRTSVAETRSIDCSSSLIERQHRYG
ncbi:hypothetical protein Tco_0547510 [Tanacetum coccineum]